MHFYHSAYVRNIKVSLKTRIKVLFRTSKIIFTKRTSSVKKSVPYTQTKLNN